MKDDHLIQKLSKQINERSPSQISSALASIRSTLPPHKLNPLASMDVNSCYIYERLRNISGLEIVA
jgi:hypothetical protein